MIIVAGAVSDQRLLALLGSRSVLFRGAPPISVLGATVAGLLQPT